MTPLLELQNITVMQGQNMALKHLSMRIFPGEHVAILGPNGSGKSTLIKLLTRELYPVRSADSALRILGQELWNVAQLRRSFGIVTNDLVAELTRPSISALEAVLSGYFSTHGLWPHLEATEEMVHRARGLLDMLGIAHLAKRALTEMSSGELRRVVLARALVHAPQSLILDEPSNSLDVAAQRELHRTMEQLAGEGISIIVVTHHLPDIIPQIDRVICLREGRIFADAPKAEVLCSDLLSRLFAAPVQVHESDGWYRF